jgi:NAD(P)-dependent dehydrogenase (short-subunit alcohol dehydrogenase family)
VSRAALVTGAAKRIGRAVALRLADEGYAVAIHYRRSRAEAEDVKAAVAAKGGRAALVQADLADRAAVDGLVAAAAAAVGPLTLLVNNASLFEPDSCETIEPELWERHFAVNLQAPAFLTRDFARQLPEGEDGAVVNIVDQRVWKLNPQFFSYTLTKTALLTATRTTAQALAPRVRVNAVGPGPTLTSSRQSPDDFARQGEALPLRRHPRPEEIADAVAFLARAGSVTGQMLAVDGGQHLAWETPDVLAVTE